MLDKFETLAMESTLAIAILANADVTDIEAVPVSPRGYSAEKFDELQTLWAPRGLRFIGAAGIVDGKARLVLAEPLDHIRVAALWQTFAAYCESFSDNTEQEQTGDEVAWLNALFALNDPRPYPHAGM